MAKKEVVQVLLDSDMKIKVAEIAARNGLSTSSWIRFLILRETDRGGFSERV
jgi:antitoxin component of RelBE/YafQ-DinJ toxin-antitoxin module